MGRGWAASGRGSPVLRGRVGGWVACERSTTSCGAAQFGLRTLGGRAARGRYSVPQRDVLVGVFRVRACWLGAWEPVARCVCRRWRSVGRRGHRRGLQPRLFGCARGPHWVRSGCAKVSRRECKLIVAVRSSRRQPRRRPPNPRSVHRSRWCSARGSCCAVAVRRGRRSVGGSTSA